MKGLSGWHFLRSGVPLLLIGAAAFVVWLGLLSPRIQSMTPGDQTRDVAIDSEIVVTFTKPVDRSRLVPSISPYIEGEWQYEKGWFGRHLFRQLRFVSHRVLDPGTIYTVTLRDVTGLIATTPATYTHQFTTRELPDISEVIPAAGATELSPQATFSVKLTEPNVGYADMSFVFEPPIEFTTEVVEGGGGYVLIPLEPLAQATQYTLSAYRTFIVYERDTETVVFQSEPELRFQGAYTIAPPPAISAVSPTGDEVYVDLPISLTFSEVMDVASVRQHFGIVPETAGDLSSADGLTFNFVPTEALTHGTEYQVRVAAGTATQDGGFIEDTVSFPFRTIGAVTVERVTPAGGATGINVSNSIHIVFDQPVDHASAEEHVTFAPSIDGSFAWQGNELIFDPSSDLGFDTTYRINIASGIKSVHGLDSDRETVATFQTIPQTFLLQIPVDYQDRPLSCEAAALKMALEGKGVSVSESMIMDRVPTYPGHRDGDTWGDPYVEFVGDINGKQNSTGYGVYWDPIATAGNTWRPSEAFTGWSVAQVTREVAKGNPVVVWGVYAGGYRDDWQTPSGKAILAWKGEHARTVIGFVGNADNPSKLILNDPNAGRIIWTRQQFETDFARFGNSGVVVR